MYYHDMKNFPNILSGTTRIRLFDFFDAMRQDVRIGVLSTVRLGLEQNEEIFGRVYDSSIHYLHLSYIDRNSGLQNGVFLERGPELGTKMVISDLSG